MPRYDNSDIKTKNQNEQDKDMIIADLTKQLGEARQQINDMSLIVADIQSKQGGTV